MHRNLKLSQLQQSINPDRYLYYMLKMHGSNRSGRLNERSVANKCVPIISTYEQVAC